MSFQGLCSFRLISRYNNFLCAAAVFRSDQQTASLTSFLSEEVIKGTAVHCLTVPAAPAAQPPSECWPSQVFRRLLSTSPQVFTLQLQVKRRLFRVINQNSPFFVCFNGLIITVFHDCKELFLISPKLG